MSWLSKWLSGGDNPANEAMSYINQIPGQTSGYYDPYIQAGKHALPSLEEQYGQLMTDPGKRMNQIGESYHESPGFKFALQQALEGAGHAQAAGGMAGTPQHEQQNIGLATDMANKDYGDWLTKALGLYGGGLSGGENAANRGLGASGSMADMIAQALAQQGQLSYAGKASQNAAKSSALSDALGFLGKGVQMGGHAAGFF